MRCFIALDIPPGVCNEIDAYKQRYDPRAHRRLSAHLTLYPPFELSGSADTLAQECALLAKRRSVRFEAGGLGTFGDRTLFVRVHADGSAQELYRAVARMIESRFGGDKATAGRLWNPHITVIQNGRADKVRRARAELAGRDFKAEFISSSIIIYAWQEGKWHVCTRAPFEDADD